MMFDLVKFDFEFCKLTENKSFFSFSKIGTRFYQGQFFATATRASVCPNQLNPASSVHTRTHTSSSRLREQPVRNGHEVGDNTELGFNQTLVAQHGG